jgi:hypothetical protein
VFDFNQDSGTGNLNVRAYLASVVGPRRVAHGIRNVKPVSGQPVQIAKSGVQGSEVVYVECWLPQAVIASLPGGGAFFAFSGNESVGENADQILLSATQKYTGILCPDDQLYVAALSDALGAPLANPVRVVVSTVVF